MAVYVRNCNKDIHLEDVCRQDFDKLRPLLPNHKHLQQEFLRYTKNGEQVCAYVLYRPGSLINYLSVRGIENSSKRIEIMSDRIGEEAIRMVLEGR